MRAPRHRARPSPLCLNLRQLRDIRRNAARGARLSSIGTARSGSPSDPRRAEVLTTRHRRRNDLAGYNQNREREREREREQQKQGGQGGGNKERERERQRERE